MPRPPSSCASHRPADVRGPLDRCGPLDRRSPLDHCGPLDRRGRSGARGLTRQALAAGALVLLAAACGADGSSSTATTINNGRETIPSAPVVKIDATNFKYSISTLRASPGEELTIAMTSKKDIHDLVLDDGKLPVRIAIASEGVTAIGGLTAPLKPGTYALYCSQLGHRGEGMESQLIVA